MEFVCQQELKILKKKGGDLIVEVSFIEPAHFTKYIEKGYHFTIEEGMKIILGVGFVLDFDPTFWAE